MTPSREEQLRELVEKWPHDVVTVPGFERHIQAQCRRCQLYAVLAQPEPSAVPRSFDFDPDVFVRDLWNKGHDIGDIAMLAYEAGRKTAPPAAPAEMTAEMLRETNVGLGCPLQTDPHGDGREWDFFADALRQRLAAAKGGKQS